ncbi:hypothetical protein FG386_001418 [Cryptosporidium ryanae]|uniref:uncharacterized protein n=1 Tax=Cryptosporidium ryanae TaxID=515981 RepID=UPI003519FDEB|nr:hypothetical protein FG386_001418 [Cryptosporidium ryanae]
MENNSRVLHTNYYANFLGQSTGEIGFSRDTIQYEPPRKGSSFSFGIGSSFVISSFSTKIYSIRNLITRDKDKLRFNDFKSVDTNKRGTNGQFSQEEVDYIGKYIDFWRKKKENEGSIKDYLTVFKNNCLFELFSYSLSKGYLASTPADYDFVFSGLKSIMDYGVWMCCCEANGKPMEYISKRSLLGLYCGTFGVSKTLEMYRMNKSNSESYLNNLCLSWSDRFALSGFCGERELSQCYLDYAHNQNREVENYSGITCSCFERIIDLLCLCIAQKADSFEIDDKVLNLWPHYVYSIITSLGTTHLGSRSLLLGISDKLLVDIREKKSKLTLNEKVIAFQFCSLILGEYRELKIGININNLNTYFDVMEIISLFLIKLNRWDQKCLLNEHSILYRYWISLYLAEIGNFDRANYLIDQMSSLLLNVKGDLFHNKYKFEFEFLKFRVRDMNFKFKPSTVKEQLERKSVTQEHNQQKNSKNSSWLVGWISDSIKKAIIPEEERWPGVENTFYFDKEINQWCQRGPDGKRITNDGYSETSIQGYPLDGTGHANGCSSLDPGNNQTNCTSSGASSPPPPPPPPQSLHSSRPGLASGGSNNVYGALGNNIRSRYVDIFQNAK